MFPLFNSCFACSYQLDLLICFISSIRIFFLCSNWPALFLLCLGLCNKEEDKLKKYYYAHPKLLRLVLSVICILTYKLIILDQNVFHQNNHQDLDVEAFFIQQSNGPNTSNGGTSGRSKKRKSPFGENSINEQFCSTLHSPETTFNDANGHFTRLANCFQLMATNANKQ